MTGELNTLFSRKPERQIQIRIQISGVELNDAQVLESSRVKQNCHSNQPFISLSEKQLQSFTYSTKPQPLYLPFQSASSLQEFIFDDSDLKHPSKTSFKDAGKGSRKCELFMSSSLSSHSSRHTQTIGSVTSYASESVKRTNASTTNPISKCYISKTPSGSFICSRGTETFSHSAKSATEKNRSATQESSIGSSSMMIASNLQKSKCSIAAPKGKITKESMKAPEIDKDSFSILGSYANIETSSGTNNSKKMESSIDTICDTANNSSIIKQRSKSEGRKSMEKDDDMYRSSKSVNSPKSLSKRSSKHSSQYSTKRCSKHRKESKFSLATERWSREKIDVTLAKPIEKSSIDKLSMIDNEKMLTMSSDGKEIDSLNQNLAVYAARLSNDKSNKYDFKKTSKKEQVGNKVSRASTEDVNIKTPTYSYEKSCKIQQEYVKQCPLRFCCFNLKPKQPAGKSTSKSTSKSSAPNQKKSCCKVNKKNPQKKRVWFRVCCCC